MTAHERNAVRERRKRQSVGNQQNRWRIDDDIVVFLSQIFQKVFHLVAFQQLVGLGGMRTAGDIGKVLVLFRVVNDFVQRFLTGKVIGQTGRSAFIEIFCDTALSDIGVDQNNLCIGKRKHQRKVCRNGRFTVFGICRRHHNHDPAVLFGNGYGEGGFEVTESFRYVKGCFVAQQIFRSAGMVGRLLGNFFNAFRV